jgi:hypothetical protein
MPRLSLADVCGGLGILLIAFAAMSSNIGCGSGEEEYVCQDGGAAGPAYCGAAACQEDDGMCTTACGGQDCDPGVPAGETCKCRSIDLHPLGGESATRLLHASTCDCG